MEKANKYCDKFGGALQASDVQAVDALAEALTALEFVREVGGGDGGAAVGAGGGGGAGDEDAEVAIMGEETRIKLHSFEIVSLINLNPTTAAAAKSLIPSLEKLADEEIENEILKLLKRASARYTGVE